MNLFLASFQWNISKGTKITKTEILTNKSYINIFEKKL